MRIRPQKTILFLLLAAFLPITACQTTYYAVWEKLGKEKRHLLKDQVEKARGEQQEAADQFKDVLGRIKEMYGFSGGDLEAFYDRLKADYEECERRAQVVRQRIVKVEQVGDDLFREWETEIGQITNARLKSKSTTSMNTTKQRYRRLQVAMNRAESRMEPVLVDLKDYVLYLKHHLNALSIGALKQEVKDIEADVGTLLKDITQSIQEAEVFLQHFESV